MSPKRIVRGQSVSDGKVFLAKEFRRKMTPEESLLLSVLRRNGLNGLHFRRQQLIAGFVVDFYCLELGLIVELDGEVHSGQLEYDAERDRILKELGFKVIRFANWQVRQDLQRVLASILSY